MFSAQTAKLCFQHEQQSYSLSTNSKVMVLAKNNKVMFPARTAKLCFQHEQQSYGLSTNSKVMVSVKNNEVMFSRRTAKLCFHYPRMVAIICMFIKVEEIRKFNLHLERDLKMLPCFVPSEHH